MAVTVVDLSRNGRGRTDTSLTTGNEVIYLVPRNAQINIQGIETGGGAAEAAVFVSLIDKNQIETEGDFSSLTQDGDAYTADFIVSTFSTGYSAVGIKITSGTWTSAITLVENANVEG
jgi:hypothetical protein